MGRGRVHLRRIENKINRQVTFCKRRAGLLKKAHEISVLCDADVALIVFSNKGKLFEFSSDSSMDKILEKYERYSYSEQHFMTGTASEPQEIWPAEYPKLTSRLEVLQRNIRNYSGQELDPLSFRELQQLEQQIDTALKRVRLRKNQLLHDSVSELQKKEKALQEQNNLLAKKLLEKEKTLNVAQWEPQNSSAFILPQPPPPPPHPFSALTIGGTFQARGVDGDTRAHQTQPSSSSTLMPPWMIRHVNGLEG
ncbi:MADS-box transcription factor FBP29 [Tripterygium wilfordii]|uniref:MADS-box transcription factor FBP29 n=1 Tax=Tripterygium wilfordii TaxID=458696 RepID=A0A7J7BTW9_TRIWF|nr:agamous-like MADS-box protein FUL-L [Tripterygium wilfordii]KAF5725423.1 MADS-box transcription factor FBP29 [Tripterygium wilfordii]